MSFVMSTTFDRTDACSVCLEEFGESAFVHGGKHPIHEECLRKLIDPRCPLCRERITDIQGKPLPPVAVEQPRRRRSIRARTAELLAASLAPGVLEERLEVHQRNVIPLISIPAIIQDMRLGRTLVYGSIPTILGGLGLSTISSIGYLPVVLGIIVGGAGLSELNRMVANYGQIVFSEANP